MKLFTCCFSSKNVFSPAHSDTDQGQTAANDARNSSASSDTSVRPHERRKNRSALESQIRQSLPSHQASQGRTRLFDTTREPPAVRATIEWLEESYFSLGNGKNGLPSKPIVAKARTGTEALGARLLSDNIIALHVTRDGILPSYNDDLFGRYLDRNKLCPLAPDRLGAIGKVTSPHVHTPETWKPDLEPRITSIDARTATHLVCARATLDLAKALLPFGAGNQVKDLVRTGGESHLRSVVAKSQGTSMAAIAPSEQKCLHYASAAITWRSGFCDENAALAFTILRSLPELEDAQVDWVANPKLCHNMAIIRGDTPEHDVIVDPWMPFAVPCLPAEATGFHQEIVQRPETNPGNRIISSKLPGELFPPLDVAAILRAHEELGEGFQDLHERYRQKIYFATPAKTIHENLTDREDPDMWDIPYNGNPNVRYWLEGEDGEPPIMLRLDMQRVAKSSEASSSS